MREDLIGSHWSQLRGAFRGRWPRLTEGDLEIEQGDVGYLTQVLQRRYEIGRFEAWKQIHEFEPGLWYFEKDGQIEAAAL